MRGAGGSLTPERSGYRAFPWAPWTDARLSVGRACLYRFWEALLTTASGGGLEEGFPKRKARRASGFCLGDGLSPVGITVRPLTEKVDVGMHPGEFCNRLMEREGPEDLARGRGGAMGAVKTGGACWRG